MYNAARTQNKVDLFLENCIYDTNNFFMKRNTVFNWYNSQVNRFEIFIKSPNENTVKNTVNKYCNRSSDAD